MSDSAPDFVSDQHLLKQIVHLALEKKAIELVAMDVRGLSSVTDFFLICSGDSEPQVKAIADNIRRGTPTSPIILKDMKIQIGYFWIISTWWFMSLKKRKEIIIILKNCGLMPP